MAPNALSSIPVAVSGANLPMPMLRLSFFIMFSLHYYLSNDIFSANISVNCCLVANTRLHSCNMEQIQLLRIGNKYIILDYFNIFDSML